MTIIPREPGRVSLPLDDLRQFDGRQTPMDIQEGDRVLVNVAALIGSVRRNEDSFPCRVLAIHDGDVEIRIEAPYAERSLRVERAWIESRVPPSQFIA